MNALFRMAPDGTRTEQLTPFGPAGNFFDISPARSGPTKDLVVYDTFAEGDTSLDVATVPATCRSLTECTDSIRFLTHNAGGTIRNGNPTWSPDGAPNRWLRPTAPASTPSTPTSSRCATTRPIAAACLFPLFDYRPDWGAAG